MTDLTITRDSELMVLHVEGETEAGTEYVDAYVPVDGHIVVVDAGRIVLPYAAQDDFLEGARQRELTWA